MLLHYAQCCHATNLPILPPSAQCLVPPTSLPRSDETRAEVQHPSAIAQAMWLSHAQAPQRAHYEATAATPAIAALAFSRWVEHNHRRCRDAFCRTAVVCTSITVVPQCWKA